MPQRRPRYDDTIRQPVPQAGESPAQYHELHRAYGHETDGRCRVRFPPVVTTAEEERAMDAIVRHG